MINFPESLPFLGLASNNCTYTTSHNRKKDLLQIFFHRPSFNNNFCFIYFPLTYHVKRFSRCAPFRMHVILFVLQFVSFLVPVFSFSPLLYSLQWKCMCVFVAYTRRFAPFVLFDVVCAVLRSSLFLSKVFDLFTSDVSRRSLYLLLLINILSDT